MIWLMEKSYLILTDSGGIQEEASTLGKPVLVMRETTERLEGITAGVAKLVGVTRGSIVQTTLGLLRNREEHAAMARAESPYGDGNASRRIEEVIRNVWATRGERVGIR
jgi:UDP-N-acetylglucosamine 2-epimerase (non-hydrolysing)